MRDSQVIEGDGGMPAFKVTSSEEPNTPIVMDSPALCWQQVSSLKFSRFFCFYLSIYLSLLFIYLLSVDSPAGHAHVSSQVMQRVNQIRASKRPKTG